MFRKLILISLVIPFCIVFQNLSSKADEVKPQHNSQWQADSIAAAKVHFLRRPRTPLYQPPTHSKIQADSIIAAIRRGEDVYVDSCEILGPLVIDGGYGVKDSIKVFTTFTNSEFHGPILLKNCLFLFGLTFSSSTFDKKVEIVACNIPTFTGFSRTTFKDTADFIFSTFKTVLLCDNATFCKHVRFLDDTIGGSTFDSTVFKEDVSLWLNDFTNFEISWRQLEGHLVYCVCNPQWVRHINILLKDFEDKRKFGDADGLYLFIKDQERMAKPRFIRYPEYWLIQLPCGYGVKPINTLILSAFIILVFACFYTKKTAIRETGELVSAFPTLGITRRFYLALYFSVHTFIIGVVTDWHPSEEFLIDGLGVKRFRFTTLSMIEGVLGWILVILFIVTLSRTFIR